MMETLALETLPVLRWADVTGNLTVRTDGLLENVTNLFTGLPNTVSGVFLSLGNNLWSAAAWMMEHLGKPLDDSNKNMLGSFINRFASLLYSSLTKDMVIIALGVIFVILSSLWLAVRNRTGMALRKMGAMILGLALFLGMGAASVGNETTAAPGTPWWLANTASSLFSEAGQGVADGLTGSVQSLGASMAWSKDPNMISCRRYLNELDTRAKDAKTDLVVRTMNTMWEETGLRMWARAQYGAGNNGMQVFCRVLEYRAGASAHDMADITSKSSGGVVKANENAMAWHPQLALIGDEGKSTDDSSDNGSYSHQVDRMIVAFDACGRFTDQDKYTARTGWSFVNAVQGDNRGFKDSGAKLGEYCRAVIEGDDGTGKNTYQVGSHNAPDDSWNVIGTQSGKDASAEKTQDANTALSACVAEKMAQKLSYSNAKQLCQDDSDVKRLQNEAKTAADKDEVNVARITIGKHEGKADADLRKLAEKFDLGEKSTWKQVAQAQNNGDWEYRNAAVNTVLQQHGQAGLSDVGGSIVFCLAGAVNLVIWGVGFGLLGLICSMAIYMLVLFGFWVGLLIYAFAPDKGRGAVARALKNLIGCCASTALIAIVCTVCSMFITLCMNVSGFTDNHGNTAGTILMGAVLSAALPVVFFKGLQYLCVKVWRIGDPLSIGNIGRLISGEAAFRGIGRVASMVGAGGAALAAGGGLGAAMNAMSGAAHGGGLLSNIARGQAAGQRAAYYKGHTQGANGQGAARHGGESAAEKAASANPDEKALDMPTQKEMDQATEEIRTENAGGDMDPKEFDRLAYKRAQGIHQFNAQAAEAAEALHSRHRARSVARLAGDMALVQARREARTGRGADGRKLDLAQRANRLSWYAGKRVGRAVDFARYDAERAVDAAANAGRRVAGSRVARSFTNAAGSVAARAGDNWKWSRGYSPATRIARTVGGTATDLAGAAARPMADRWSRYSGLNPLARTGMTAAATVADAAKAVAASDAGRVAGLDRDYANRRNAAYTHGFVDPRLDALNGTRYAGRPASTAPATNTAQMSPANGPARPANIPRPDMGGGARPMPGNGSAVDAPRRSEPMPDARPTADIPPVNAPLPTREPRRTVHDYTPDYTADNVPQPPADIADIPPIGDPMPQARPDAAVGQAKAGVPGGNDLPDAQTPATAEPMVDRANDVLWGLSRSGNPVMQDMGGAAILDGVGFAYPNASAFDASRYFYEDPVGALREAGVSDGEIRDISDLVEKAGPDVSPTELGEAVARIHERHSDGR